MATHERSNKPIDDGISLTKQKPLFCVKFLLHVKNPKNKNYPSVHPNHTSTSTDQTKKPIQKNGNERTLIE